MNVDELRRRIRLRDLETLAAVVDAGGMRKAASVLNLSQPAVSRAIRDMEERLGVKLLLRGRRGIEPTPFGLALARRSTVVFDEVLGALKELAHLADPAAGEVRLGCMETLHAGIVAAALARLSKAHPRMHFVLESGQSADLIDHFLRHRMVDFVVARPLSTPLPPDIEGEPLFSDRLLVVVGPDTALARKRRVGLVDLQPLQWILSRNELMPLSPVVRAFTHAGLEMPQRVISSGSLHTRFALLREEDVVTVVPHSLLPFADYRARVRVLPISLEPWEIPTMVLTLRGRFHSPTAGLFLEELRRLARPLREA